MIEIIENQENKEMKMKGLRKKIAAAARGTAAVMLAAALIGCSQDHMTFAPEQSDHQNDDIQYLSFKESKRSFNKLISASEMISAQNGGQVTLEYGGADNFYYAMGSGNSNVYRVDETGSSVVGQFANTPMAIAMSPIDGKVYYLTIISQNDDDNNNGHIYQLAVWNPEDGSNSTITNDIGFQPAGKLAFAPNGDLFAIKKSDTKKIYKIDTQNGDWTLATTASNSLSSWGDIAIDSDGTFYNVDGFYKRLHTVDLQTGSVNTVGTLHVSLFEGVTGLAFSSTGDLILSTNWSKVYSVNKNTAALDYLSNPGISWLDDLASAGAEFSYLRITLDIPAGAIDQDMEISLQANTNELFGGVYVTFGPHGTNFNLPVRLNIIAQGVDLDGIDLNAIDIYYDNQDNGTWELMPRTNVNIDAATGTIEVIDALLEHFSRYALAHS